MNHTVNAQQIVNLCTLFDSNFILKGLALISSVERHSSFSIKWTVLALDSFTERYLENLSHPNIEIVNLQTINDYELLALVGKRPWREICWTSAACLLNYVKNKSDEERIIAYVDADCFFYNDIFEVFDPLKIKGSIGIHEHRFSSDRASFLETSGRFNVGLVCGIVGGNFNDCIERWRNQVLEDCSVNPTLGKCGDQTYLNEWPHLYEHVVILDDKGVGGGPWNMNNYKISKISNNIYFDEVPLKFFHFHGLNIAFLNKLFAVYIPASGYKYKRSQVNYLYKQYIRNLQKLITEHPELPIPKVVKGLKWWGTNIVKFRFFFKINL